MKINGALKFVVFASASAMLMSVVLRTNAGQPLFKPAFDISGSVLQPPPPPDTPQVKLPYNFNDNNGRPPQYDDKSKLYLETPSNVKTETSYDPKTGNYNVTQKMGDMRYRPDTYIDAQDYQDLQFSKAVHDYWRTRIKADDQVNKPKKGIVPKLQVNSELFDRIFGGNTVDIRPTGTAELIFGLNRNKTLNPAIPQRQQKVTNFDFNMRIQLNLIGKIGDKLKITTSYNTEASFDWENQVKLDYTGYEDEIIKKIEAGNVSLPLNSSLITGSQSLFGIKAQLQFGKLTATTIFSQQRGKKQEVTLQGGAQTTPFTVTGDNYEANKHFFLAHYFRDNYNTWMSTLPVINTPVVITKVEVYLLNQTGNQEQTRSVVAFEDLGEDSANVHPFLKAYGNTCLSDVFDYGIHDSAGVQPYNGANSLYSLISNPTSGLLKNRDGTQASSILTQAGVYSNSCNVGSNQYMVQARDFDIITNARKLNPTEYVVNNRLGFISLNQALNNDQALAVSFQYQYNGKTYQVGEFSDQFPDNTKSLFCKLLKGVNTNVRFPLWKLMMKNVYSIGAYNLNQQDFKLDIYYNNIETGVDIPYLPYGPINGQLLVRVLGLDKLSVNGDKFSDGIFDFLPGYTINPANGRVYFTTIEPFGSTIRSKLDPNDANSNKYVFQELYDSTRVSAQQLPEKNRYKLKGSYKSSSGSEISLNALNIPQGAVRVTANGQPLAENTDYTVDYTLGRVKIINDAILNSGAQIKVSVESNSLFNVQQKSLMGTRLDYKVNRDLTLGGTFLRYAEKPVTQKVNTGDEPVSNIIWGTDYNYKTDVPFLTRLIDKLPFISTKEMSSITTQGEFAQLVPGNAAAIGKDGTSYIDDFEGSISLIDIRNAQSWFLASIPQGQPSLFPEAGLSDDINAGKNRARFNWYTIDPSLTRTQNQGGSAITPPGYNKNTYSNNLYRQVLETELFPGKTPPNGQPVVLPVLDLGFYPAERGPYNYDNAPVSGLSAGMNHTNGKLNNPKSRWGGIMRRLETNDFQAANIEYIQFWMMDPFNEDYNSSTHPDMDANNKPTGDMYIDLGNVSEDIVKDGHMTYENGIPGPSNITSSLPTVVTNVAVAPTLPPIANAFSSDPSDRAAQDVGYDGLNDDAEKSKFAAALNGLSPTGDPNSLIDQFINDPSSDDYHFFRGDDYDGKNYMTLIRYSKYNNPQGNSPTEDQYKSLNSGGYSTSATNVPNIEDLNKDNTLSETENYYQYHVKISKADIDPTNVGHNYIVNSFDGTGDIEGVKKTVKWYQFKIPITQFENVVGGIEGFNSIRFMRVYMKGFDKPVVIRLARFEFVRSDWRRYLFDLAKPGEYLANDDNTTAFDVSAVSVQENGQKTPVNYVIPPKIQQVQNIQTTNLVLQNEQALQLRVSNLKDGDSRAIYKNVDLDTRMFKHLQMFVHAEKVPPHILNDGDLTIFVRLGTDYNDNYYEYEIPLSLTPAGYYDPNSDDAKNKVWPLSNDVNIPFDALTNAKEARNATTGKDLAATAQPYTVSDGNNKITVVGNPNLGGLKSIMVGIRNPKDPGALPKYAEVWINELRLTDFNNKGGWATTGRVQAKLADLGQVSLSALYSTPFFGSVEKKINDRSKETNFNWDMASTFQLGKFFPAKWKVTLPVYYSLGETRVTPLFNPYEPDVSLSSLQSSEQFSAADIRNIKKNSIDYTRRRGLNFTNVRIDGLKRKGAKPMPWDLSNFSFTYAFTENLKHNVNVDHNIVRQYRGNITYGFTLQPKSWKPFAKVKLFENKWFTILREMNVQPLPNRFGVSMDVNRNYSELLNRDLTSFYTNDIDRTLTQFNKTFNVTRVYDFRWDLTKSLKFDYTANNDGRILEPRGAIDTHEKKDSLINNMKSLGVNTNFRQQFNINYTVPLNKIPLFDWVTATYKYGGTYTWTRKPFASDSLDYIGNTIQNTNSSTYNISMNMLLLYNKIPYFKRLNSGGTGLKSKDKAKDKKKNTNKNDSLATDENKDESSLTEIAAFVARAVMMVKNVTISMQETNGQGLPNFRPTAHYLGMDDRSSSAPGLAFISGSQQDIRQQAADKGWLTKNVFQTTPYTKTQTKNLTYRSSVEPHSSLKIEVTGSRTSSYNLSEYTRWDTAITADHPLPSYQFNESRTLTGNYSISVFTLGRAFKDKSTGVSSNLFSEFLSVRQDYARKLSQANSKNSAGLLTNGVGQPYYDGYSPNQQDVLMGAFYETYTGRKIKNFSTTNVFPNIPMPNWTLSWDGLGKIKQFKKLFRSITLRSGYRSMYNMGGYSNNLLYGADSQGNQIARSPVDPGSLGQTANFNSYYSVSSVAISEQFAPLIKVDLQFTKPGWQGNFEVKKDKTVTLNLTGPQIIETKGQEYVLGLGYRYPKLTIKKLQIQGKPLQSDLNIKVDLSYRRNVSVIRSIVDEISTPTGGTDIITLRSSIDYQLTQNINLRLFYDWIRTKPQTSASFPTSNTNAGFSLRINLQ